MGEIVCHHNGWYNIYQTTSDLFLFNEPISIDQLKKYIKDKFGKQGIKELPDRLHRAHKRGCSVYPGENLEHMLMCNTAGKNGASLSFKGCIYQFSAPKQGVKYDK